MSKKNQTTKITITIPKEAYFVSGIRDFTLNLIKNTTSFGEKWAFRFQSVVDELSNNAIEHGSAEGSEIRISYIYKKDDYAEFLIEDTGTGPNKINSQKLKELFDSRREPGYTFTGIRGRGLVKIVGEWTDEIEFMDGKQGGIIVRVKKFLKNSRESENKISSNNNNLITNKND